jgi:hypothetical protein
MDMSDLAGPARGDRPAFAALDAQALVAQLGSEVAAKLSSALERVTSLTRTGRIDKSSLRALREEIELARRAGILGQQLARLTTGQVRLAPEELDLTALLREALVQRRRDIEARGIDVLQVLSPAAVEADATLLFTLLQTVLDWALEHTVSRIELSLQTPGWPPLARLHCSFAHRLPDSVDTTAAALQAPREVTALNSMSWRLIQQACSILGLEVQREDTAGRTALSLAFPGTLAPSPPRLQGVVADPVAAPTTQSAAAQPLAGHHVLVLATRREVRNLIRQALRPMGLMLDFAGSVEEARLVCADGLPHALVYEASLGGSRFERLRDEMLDQLPTLAFVRVEEDGRAVEVINAGSRQITSVGRDAIVQSLPAALQNELARNG